MVLHPDACNPGGVPQLLGFAFDMNLKKAEILTNYCGVNLDQGWTNYMKRTELCSKLEFKQRVIDMGL